MYISPEELQTHLYERNIKLITEQNEYITQASIDTAVFMVKSYLTNRYDTKKIFSAEGEDRHPLILDLVKTIAAYKLVSLANPQILGEKYYTAYQEAKEYLTQIAQGILSPDLPTRELEDGTKVGGTVSISSHPKFQHDLI